MYNYIISYGHATVLCVLNTWVEKNFYSVLNVNPELKESLNLNNEHH
jgi:hypothetical protein